MFKNALPRLAINDVNTFETHSFSYFMHDHEGNSCLLPTEKRKDRKTHAQKAEHMWEKSGSVGLDCVCELRSEKMHVNWMRDFCTRYRYFHMPIFQRQTAREVREISSSSSNKHGNVIHRIVQADFNELKNEKQHSIRYIVLLIPTCCANR